ncbi:MAG: hypothetical protein RRX93_08490, partial [Bacteroidales bacterium]
IETVTATTTNCGVSSASSTSFATTPKNVRRFASAPTATNMVGNGLYELRCHVEKVYYDSIYMDLISGLPITVSIAKDTNICAFEAIDTIYSLTICDSVSISVVDRVEKRIIPILVFDPGSSGYITQDSIVYDTILTTAYEVRCRTIDTTYHHDTIPVKLCVPLTDTVIDADTLTLKALGNDSILQFCPRFSQSHYLYLGLHFRYADSANYYRLLAQMQPTMTKRDSCLALADVYTQRAIDYHTAILHTINHKLDSAKIAYTAHTSLGCDYSDTLSISVIPIYYTHITDTILQHGRSTLLYTNSQTAHFAWGIPTRSNHTIVNIPGTRYNTTEILSSNLNANVENPYYRADTLDLPAGALFDTLFFPVKITNYDSVCSTTDQVPVIIQKGYRVAGYVSYNAHWKPSTVGDTNSHDNTIFDNDLIPTTITHMPIARVKVSLYDYQSHNLVDTTTSDTRGYFTFNKLMVGGTYYLYGTSPQK